MKGRKKLIGYGMTLGIFAGAIVAALTDDWASWIPVGLAVGLALGAGLAMKQSKQG